MTNTVSMGEVKKLVNYTIDNNLRLQQAGKTPIAIALESSAGIGKTSIVQQVAAERGMTAAKISLAQFDEPGDITGYPQIEYECQLAKMVRDEKGNMTRKVMPGTVWLNVKQLESLEKGTSRQTGRTRMGYAKPAWVPEYNENGTILLLDDFNRANPMLLQSMMEVVLTQKYASWALPKKTTVILTSNPEDGQSNVNGLDEAQRTRFLNFEVKWDSAEWCRWAEKSGLDGRCINFVMNYADELFGADENGERICNPRSFTMFADMISGVQDWDSPESLSFITGIAKGCFKDEDSKFAGMFSSFIRSKMHLLIQPREMLLGAWDRVRTQMESVLYDSDGQYRPDIASILERRFANYVPAWLDSEEKTPIATVRDRILDFIGAEENGGKRLFSKDLLFHMIKAITSSNKGQTNKLLNEPAIVAQMN